MEEFFFRAIERVGFPIAVSLFSFYCVLKLYQARESDKAAGINKLIVEAQKQTASLDNIEKKAVCKYAVEKDSSILPFCKPSSQENA